MVAVSFSEKNFHAICNELAARDKALATIIANYGYPPLWHREEGFATLVQIILEQQVSLASAKVVYERLKAKAGTITPKKILAMTDEDLRECAFSRQKAAYVKHLATAVINKQLDIESLGQLTNDEIRTQLITIKGIGHWTVEVYLMMVLHRCDLLPMGDIALIKSIKEIKALPDDTPREKL